MKKTEADYFWAKVEKTEGCWIWRSYVRRDGYGNFNGDRAYSRLAHRVALRLSGADVPRDRQVDHLCRNRLCVRPDHLEVVDRRTNILRGNSPAARAALKVKCVRGHPFNESNTMRVAKGRRCRICDNERQRAKNAALGRVRRPRLSPEKVREIRAAALRGMRQADLARQYGVHPTMIAKVVQRRAYARVP